MRFMLTLSVVHDDTHDAADLETAATDVWLEVYPTDTDPVETATAGAVVLDREGLETLLSALEVGADGDDTDVTYDALASLREALTRCEVTA